MKKVLLNWDWSRLISQAFFALAFLYIVSLIILYTGNIETFETTQQRHIHTADDHMITMRVARNFWETGLPYFNETEAVAANTSLFWPIILGSTVMSFGPVAAVAANVMLSVGMSAFTVAISLLILRDWPVRIAAAILMIFSSTFIKYAATGWEHVPQAMFFTFGMVLINRASRDRFVIPSAAMLLICLSFLFRADSAVVIFLSGIVWFFHNDNFKRYGTYVWCALFLIIPSVYLFFMNYFYGSFVPNTAYLKNLDVEDGLRFGIAYVINPLKSGLVPIFLLALLALRPKSTFSRFVLFLGLGHLCYVIYIGGDVFGGGRFFFFLMPIVVVVVIREFVSSQIWGSQEKAYAVAFSAIVVCLMATNYKVIINQVFLSSGVEGASPVEEQVRLLSDASEKIGVRDGSIGLHYLGVAYHFPDFHVVDFLGKAEPRIAQTEVQFGPIGHNRWDYEYTFAAYDIAIIPIQDRVIERVIAPDFVLKNKNYMFWDECAQIALRSGNYQYVPAEYFGNRTFGALVRTDLLGRFER